MLKKFPVTSAETGTQYLVKLIEISDFIYAYDVKVYKEEVSLFGRKRMKKVCTKHYTKTDWGTDYIGMVSSAVSSYESVEKVKIERKERLNRNLTEFNEWDGVVR